MSILSFFVWSCQGRQLLATVGWILQHAGITAGSRVRTAKSSRQLLPALVFPQLTQPRVLRSQRPSWHKHSSCRIARIYTPETDPASRHFSPEKKAHLNAPVCNRKDCCRSSCFHPDRSSTPSQNQTHVGVQSTEYHSFRASEITSRLYKR